MPARWPSRGPSTAHRPSCPIASLKLSASGDVDQPPSVDVYGALAGSESDATELVDELVGRVGSDGATPLARSAVLRLKPR